MLITAFEPFGPWERNTSEDVGRAVADAVGAELLVLPVDLMLAPPRLIEGLAGHDTALCLGLHGRARALRVERVGINVADFEVPDNAGHMAASQPLDVAGPDARLSSVDVRGLVAAMRQAGVTADVSNSAGTYLCNAVYFTALQRVRALFVHLPPAPGDAVQALAREAPSGRRDWFGEGLSGEQGGIDPAAGLALDLQIRGAILAARALR